MSVHKQRTGASAVLDRIVIPADAHQVLLHVRDYTKGHPQIAANNHPSATARSPASTTARSSTTTS